MRGRMMKRCQGTNKYEMRMWDKGSSVDLGRGFCEVRWPGFGIQCARNGVYGVWFSSQSAMSQPPYRALQVALRIFSVLFAVGGLFMIFGNRGLIIRVFVHPPEAEVSTLLLFLLKEMGGMVLMVSAMLFRASRDPVRNVAVVDGLIVGLVILAITPLLSLRRLDIPRIYPGHLVWGRSVIRLVLAAFFFYLRPREAHWKPAGLF